MRGYAKFKYSQYFFKNGHDLAFVNTAGKK